MSFDEVSFDGLTNVFTLCYVLQCLMKVVIFSSLQVWWESKVHVVKYARVYCVDTTCHMLLYSEILWRGS